MMSTTAQRRRIPAPPPPAGARAMPPKASQGYANAHAFQPNRNKKIKVKEKSALECAVGASLAGVCSRCCEQLKWCARNHVQPCDRAAACAWRGRGAPGRGARATAL
jgi:hypothetical protein